MKKMLLLLLFTVPVMAQDGFKTEDGKIVWERIFPEGSAEIKSLIESQENLKLLSSDDITYIGQGEAVKNTTSTTSVRLKCDANFNFSVVVAPQGYIVRVTNFMFLEKYGPMQMRVVPNSLEKYYLEYGKIRNTPKTQEDLSHVDNFLTGIFSNQGIQSTALTSN